MGASGADSMTANVQKLNPTTCNNAAAAVSCAIFKLLGNPKVAKVGIALRVTVVISVD